jgi:hypothetical protein
VPEGSGASHAARRSEAAKRSFTAHGLMDRR